jgi:hypothetical protein
MNRSLITSALVTFTLLAGCTATDTKPAANAKPAGGAPPEMKLPPDWTEADMQACMIAGTPGKEHERLLKDVGVWKGKNTMWHYPGAEPVVSEATCTITSFMDGRYTKTEWAGEMPGMGPYKGFGLNGYDNVAGKYVNLWVDNMSTGLLNGTGMMSPDGTTLTWNSNYICPITKKTSVFRQIEKNTGPGAKTLEMYGEDPKTGKEYKMMMIEMKRQ